MSRVRLDEDGEMYIKVKSKGNTKDFGKEWDDGGGGQVKQICIWYGDLVCGIQVSYERNGTTFLSERHGGTEGDFEQIQFHEPITWVSGHYGSWCLEPDIYADEEEAPYNYTQVIRSLKFGTDQATYGPFGYETGTPFRFKMNTGCAGFHGHSSSNEDYGYLKAIGVYVRSLAKSPLVGGSSLSVPPPTPSLIPKVEVEGNQVEGEIESIFSEGIDHDACRRGIRQ
ncbi:hypothetical protein J5N97_026152 [Dioscorea zingiberensis]|uniref:Jacalin-type lectin domain-containing protein n=1 Tax=Dioscorea zingiberensis TaxID=325984 RepID=A0A9D5H690_9LILI|nr:hypothetical protein J5N97_026152 [Dioscorea zingiberensis]